MKPGRASKTAELVCASRAYANGTTSVAKFSDPVALDLLPADARLRIERMKAGEPARGPTERLKRVYLQKQSHVMVARTVEIDDAIREAASPQLVILGAGLDARAWRMPELADVVVFEVDHPDSQRDKRARIGSRARLAREVKFVTVDFTRDSLDDALEAAGHDRTRPTTWVWEGVIMYLSRADIESTLTVVERRSAPKSRLIGAYHSPARMLRLVGFVVRMLGEPLRSRFTSAEMRTLLEKYGFRVERDTDIATIATRLSENMGREIHMVKHLRIAIADSP